MNFMDQGTDGVDYEHINKTIIYGSVANILLVISKVNFGVINAKD